MNIILRLIPLLVLLFVTGASGDQQGSTSRTFHSSAGEVSAPNRDLAFNRSGESGRTGGSGAGPLRRIAQKSAGKEESPSRSRAQGAAPSKREADAKPSNSKDGQPWRSEELPLLAVGLAVGDVDGDGKNELVIVDPSNVYVYSIADGKLNPVAQYSARPLEIKTVDVARIRKQGPERIYVSAQNRGAIASFVLELRGTNLVPVIQDCPYFIRVINYPTLGPLLLGQKRGVRTIYDGPVYRMIDKGDDLAVQERFGVPLVIPIFGFTIGDFSGDRKPLIAVYDKDDHLRIYKADGSRLFRSNEYYGGSDVILRLLGPETLAIDKYGEESETIFSRPRIVSINTGHNSANQIVAIMHASKTLRMMARSKALSEGQVVGLAWTGDNVEEKWATPKTQGLIADFAIATLPGFSGRRLVTLERRSTDWLSLVRSKSLVRVYDLDAVIAAGLQGERSPRD
jgi:hypothetical protein